MSSLVALIVTDETDPEMSTSRVENSRNLFLSVGKFPVIVIHNVPMLTHPYNAHFRFRMFNPLKLSVIIWLHFECSARTPQCPNVINWKWYGKVYQVRQLSRLAYRPIAYIPHADPPRRHSQRWQTRRNVVIGQLSHLVRDCPMRYQRFSLFGLEANPWAVTHPDLPFCQISSPCVNTRRRYPLQKCGQRIKQTNSKRYIPMWG